MQKVFLAAFAAFLCISSVWAQRQVDVREAGIRADFSKSPTVVSLPVSNTSDVPIHAKLSLSWTDRGDKEVGAGHRSVVIPPGQSMLEATVPLRSSSLWTRLRYTLVGEPSEARQLGIIQGVVALPQISKQVFELRASYVGSPRPGLPLVFHAETVHPATRIPVTDIEWTATLEIDDKTIAPTGLVAHEEGFIEITFTLPVRPGKELYEEAVLEVSAERGDFKQDVRLPVSLPTRLTASIQSDKPIYQPEQMLHLRAVVQDAQGRAAPNTKLTLRIDDEDGDRVHTAELVSSAYGILQDDWQIPPSASLGTYGIFLKAEGDDDYEIAEHLVRVSRYELPTFTVTATPSRSAFLPTEEVQIRVAGSYLFGKPVPNGLVKIVRSDQPHWGALPRDADDFGTVVAEGTAGGDGTFNAVLDLKEDRERLQTAPFLRYQDIHFAAYFEDPASGRTEQRRFDVRLSREPIHIYLIQSNQVGSLATPFYVSASYADGRPASVSVEVKYQGRSSEVRTNRYGVGRVALMEGNGTESEIELRATDDSGRMGHWKEHFTRFGGPGIRISSERTLYRAGEAVSLQLESSPELPSDQVVLVHAIAGDVRVASRLVRLEKHKGNVSFPYDSAFRRTVAFVAWNATDPRGGFGGSARGMRAVVFPEGSDLRVEMSTGRDSYKPGEKAALQVRVSSMDGKPVKAALGLAVVDQAILEKARTESEFGGRRWFSCAFCGDSGESQIGGVSLHDLLNLNTRKISDELDLVAEALVANEYASLRETSSENTFLPPSFAKVVKQTKEISEALERHYARTLEFPQDLESLNRIFGALWAQLEDPWGRPYTAKFSVDLESYRVTILSAGPDKVLDTADDFPAAIFVRAYYLPVARLMQEILDGNKDYPATPEDFSRLLSENGLLLSTLRDPWGTSYRAQVHTWGAQRRISIHSAGPDETFGTADDVPLVTFTGHYFQREAAEIESAVSSQAPSPQTIGAFQERLDRAGIDIAQYRDAWGHPYRIASRSTASYANRVDSKVVRSFGGAPSAKTDIVPVTQKFIIFSLRSSGNDGIPDTYDDFDVAQFPVLLAEESAPSESPSGELPAAAVRGMGSIVGVVTDVSGALIPGATATLSDTAGSTYTASTGSDGTFRYLAVPPGTYSLRVSALGFTRYEVLQIPVVAEKVTDLAIELQLGSTAEMVTVEDTAAVLQTESASISAESSGNATSTPRVREYFPETLLWLPELITDEKGVAKTELKLADSVTTWKIAVFASTLDGRSVEAASDLRAFQPFFLDFDPPTVLTQGDRIDVPVALRNYEDRDQKVSVTMAQSDWASIEDSATKQITVPANSSSVLSYRIEAKSLTEKGKQRISAQSARSSDAIEKWSRVRPDGQETVQYFGDFVAKNTSFPVKIPANAIRGATRGELRVYPNIAALLLESASSILTIPHGCAEQTISAGYANLAAWRFARAVGLADERIEKQALANVRRSVGTLAHLQDGEGGVRYWPGTEPDVALTAYALQFLADASGVTRVEQDALKSMAQWLAKKQFHDGRWLSDGTDTNAESRTLLLSSTVARALSAAQKAGVEMEGNALAGAYHQIAQLTDSVDEPYALANFILSAMDSGDEALLGNAMARLVSMAHAEREGFYWDLRSNSPFYGWGTAGRIETTGLVISALSQWRAAHPAATELDAVIRRGLLFLLKGRGATGIWASTQSTVRAMRAIADVHAALGIAAGDGGALEIRANGKSVRSIALPDASEAVDPILVDLSAFLTDGNNEITVAPAPGTQSVVVQLASSHWLPWEQTSAAKSPELSFTVDFDRLETKVGEAVQCSVKAERVGFRGYGMLLAEVGLPPGATVDRSSLEAVLDDWTMGLDHYEILPDRVVFYLWPKAGGAAFDFALNLRLPMTAKSTRSLLYDYSNPEAASEIRPLLWVVK